MTSVLPYLNGAPNAAAPLKARHASLGRADDPPRIGRLWTACVLFGIRARFRVKLSGELPADGCVVVALHDSLWDGPIATLIDPRFVPIVSGHFRKHRIVGPVMNAFGSLWTSDDVVTMAPPVCRRGGMIWIAPFGFDRPGITPELKSGAARIAQAADCPVVPMYLRTTPSRRLARLRRTTVEVEIGEPMRLDPAGDPATEGARYTQRFWPDRATAPDRPAAA